MRDGGPDDVGAVLRVKNETWRTAYRGLLPQDFLDGLSVTPRAVQAWRARIGSGAQHLAVGEAGGEVSGFVLYGPAEDEGTGGAEIHAIYVLAEHWSTGLGLALMAHAVGHLAELGYREAGLWVLEGNARARRFYERFGFTPSGRVQDVDGLPFPAPELHYRMALATG
ncbi:GNAT family N-acetyltransferase [Planomonospora venezuelensis]|uniref:GNAT superfamily N-acetyltransferase n=1 Tax=Planomonospora venezuelensis TaxID=1999 RepID=A0A841D7P6_PLAVE|nr:GNAT superfamily N-acetyltransferase [Planomonospora venezuelensis]GIN04333.1 N-acetyltransferase [Planomonospora venezuelensis]